MAGSPKDFCKGGSEDGEQTALFAWVRMATFGGIKVADDDQSYVVKGYAAEHKGEPIPLLNLLFAIPNGGARDPRVGAILKATGVKPGVSDMFLPVPKQGVAGLWIELKKAKGGTESPEQKAWGKEMQNQGFGYCVCHGWIEARNILVQYLEL